MLAATIQHAVQANVGDEQLGRVGAAFGVSDAAAALAPTLGLAVTLNVFSVAVALTGQRVGRSCP